MGTDTSWKILITSDVCVTAHFEGLESKTLEVDFCFNKTSRETKNIPVT